MISQLAQSLYADTPDSCLYHYTTISGFQGVVSNRCLWASDVRYMNDAQELQYIVGLLKENIDQYPKYVDLLKKFIHWITNRISNGHMVFAVSFRANGNLLSQWRGYSDIGKGISLGFSSDDIAVMAKNNHFTLGRCIYDKKQQKVIICQLLEDLIELLDSKMGDKNESGIESIFYSAEVDILRIAALLKHPSFIEEDEWRLVSNVVAEYLLAPVSFREGKTMLIPYYELVLADEGASLSLDHVYVGPTPNSQLSLNSVRLYLLKQGVNLRRDVSYCNIPYRGR